MDSRLNVDGRLSESPLPTYDGVRLIKSEQVRVRCQRCRPLKLLRTTSCCDGWRGSTRRVVDERGQGRWSTGRLVMSLQASSRRPRPRSPSAGYRAGSRGSGRHGRGGQGRCLLAVTVLWEGLLHGLCGPLPTRPVRMHGNCLVVSRQWIPLVPSQIRAPNSSGRVV